MNLFGRGTQFLLGRLKRGLRAETVRFYLEPPSLPMRATADVQAIDVDLEQIDRWSREHVPFPWSEAMCKARFAEGHRLRALMVEGRPVSFAWETEADHFAVGELDGVCHFPFRARILWDCVTPDDQRGRGYYPRLLSTRMGLPHQPRTLIYVRAGNAPSIRGIEKAGFIPWVTVRTWRWGSYCDVHDRARGLLRVEKRSPRA